MGSGAVVHELDGEETEPPNGVLAGVGWGEYTSGGKGLRRQGMAATSASLLPWGAGYVPELSGFDG